MTILCPNCNKGTVFVSKTIIRCIMCMKDIEKTFIDSLLSLKKGKVILCTVHGRKPLEHADINMLAVGKPKGQTYFNLGWEHVPALAPSRELVTFTKAHNAAKGRLDGWFERYTDSLLDEWMIRGDSLHAIEQLVKDVRAGKVIAVSCYCSPAKRDVCHLSILRNLLEDLGCLVEEAEPIEYK